MVMTPTSSNVGASIGRVTWRNRCQRAGAVDARGLVELLGMLCRPATKMIML